MLIGFQYLCQYERDERDMSILCAAVRWAKHTHYYILLTKQIFQDCNKPQTTSPYKHTHTTRRTLSIVLAPVSATSVAKRLLPDLKVSRKVGWWLLIFVVGLSQQKLLINWLLLDLLLVGGGCLVLFLSCLVVWLINASELLATQHRHWSTNGKKGRSSKKVQSRSDVATISINDGT